MNWKNTAIDALPRDGEEVLISVNGINYVATYTASINGFSIKHKPLELRIDEHIIYWTEIELPGGTESC
ncbi:MAG: hypothetical protein H0W61_12695 [Bacteroidetes bacterium]|nr:hypothetical protein [Bacteroidota bacterium]